VVSQGFIVDLYAGVIGEPGLHDGIEPWVHHHPHGVVGSTMRHNDSVATMAFFTYCLEFLHRKSRPEGVCAQGAPAGAHDLQEVSTLFNELPSRLPNAIHTVSLGTHEPAVTTGGGDGSASRQDAGPLTNPCLIASLRENVVLFQPPQSHTVVTPV
jgi:hypothetical protein